LIDHANFQITINTNLARQAHVVGQLGFHRQTVALELAHLTRVSLKNLNAASGATGITAAAVENINAGVLDDQDKFFSLGRLDGLSAGCSFSYDRGHRSHSIKVEFDSSMNLAQLLELSKRSEEIGHR
jgi:hypothetical protein